VILITCLQCKNTSTTNCMSG